MLSRRADNFSKAIHLANQAVKSTKSGLLREKWMSGTAGANIPIASQNQNKTAYDEYLRHGNKQFGLYLGESGTRKRTMVNGTAYMMALGLLFYTSSSLGSMAATVTNKLTQKQSSSVHEPSKLGTTNTGTADRYQELAQEVRSLRIKVAELEGGQKVVGAVLRGMTASHGQSTNKA